MFEMLSYLQLQQLWWIVISLIGGLFVFLLFIQGGQTLISSLSSNETEKSLIVNTLGRKWELGFTTLVLFGGACFAAFPLFYSVSFGGAYWVWLAILFCFILQAVSYEYRTKPNNFLGQKTFEVFLFINGLGAVLLLGVALSTFFTGSNFIIGTDTSLGANRFVEWGTPFRGLEAVLDWRNFLLAGVLIFLTRLNAALYIIKTVDSENIAAKAYKKVKIETVIFLVFFLAFAFILLTHTGFAYKGDTYMNTEVYLVAMKGLNAFLGLPIVLGVFLVGVVLVLAGLLGAIFKQMKNAIWLTGIGTVLVAMCVLLVAGLGNSPFYPSYASLNDSLTIQNASSSRFTLITMSYIALSVPFVLAYIIYAWHAMTKTKITANEVAEGKDQY